jgi:hypothetical protein
VRCQDQLLSIESGSVEVDHAPSVPNSGPNLRVRIRIGLSPAARSRFEDSSSP